MLRIPQRGIRGQFNPSLTMAHAHESALGNHPVLPHVFAHDGILYEVSFGRIAGQWLAAVGELPEGSKRLLPAFAEADCEQFSEAAIRAGYAGVAEWLVRTGRWKSISADQEDAIRSRLLPAKAAETIGRSPCASMERQDIGATTFMGCEARRV
jgi:hypothetical protein